jgi:hypothetical protein
MFIKIADFTIRPGGRYREDGPYSGEEFRETILIPALEKGDVVVDLSDLEGVGSSFLEEIFGGIVRAKGPEVRNKISIISHQSPSRVAKATRYLG